MEDKRPSFWLKPHSQKRPFIALLPTLPNRIFGFSPLTNMPFLRPPKTHPQNARFSYHISPPPSRLLKAIPLTNTRLCGPLFLPASPQNMLFPAPVGVAYMV